MKNKYGNSIYALALIAVGVLLVLQNFNLPFFKAFSLGNIIGLLWPLFILVPGLNLLSKKSKLFGIILTLIGGSFLLDNLLGFMGFNFHVTFIFKFFWPLIFIYLGFKILKSKSDNGDPEKQANPGVDTQNITFNSKSFRFDLDNTPLGISKLTLNISFGGAEILIEEGIQVILLGQYVFGGHEFFDLESGGVSSAIKEVRYFEDENQVFDRTLIIKANITFGGLEIHTL